MIGRAALTIAALLATLLPGSGHAADPLTLQLNWLPRAQHAGYLLAQAKGYFADEGLSVIIRPGGPDVAPAQVLATGGADVIIGWLPTARAAREAGLPMVNIAQPFADAGLWLVCRADSGITTANPDLRGHSIAVWANGSDVPLRIWLQGRGLSADAVTLLPQETGIDQLLNKRASCISAMSHDEVIQFAETGIPTDALVSFRLDGPDGPFLADGLYVLDQSLNDPRMRDRLVRFVRAAMRGWQDARQNPDDAVMILQSHGAGATSQGGLTPAQQRRRLDAVLALRGDGTGALDEVADGRPMPAQLSTGGATGITGEPAGAFPQAFTEALRK